MIRQSISLLLLLVSGSCLAVPEYDYRIIERYPHRVTAFTQGLLVHDGLLYEGTGLHGRSGVSIMRLEDGSVLQHRALPERYFGEGIAIAGDRLFQLTWRSNLVFVYHRDTLEPITTHYHPGEGWGLAFDGEQLILSDGSDTLQFLDTEDFSVQRRVSVTLEGQPVHQLNELEYINGEIWANVWMSEQLVRIAPEDGRVTAVVDLSGLADKTRRGGRDAVLNGIAWDEAEERLLVTGKLWGDIFEIELIPASPPSRP